MNLFGVFGRHLATADLIGNVLPCTEIFDNIARLIEPIEISISVANAVEVVFGSNEQTALRYSHGGFADLVELVACDDF